MAQPAPEPDAQPAALLPLVEPDDAAADAPAAIASETLAAIDVAEAEETTEAAVAIVSDARPPRAAADAA
jgi:hypothetical protein